MVALAGVDLSIPAGEVHGLLGPNGAGKTTLCKILSTVLLPTAGRAAVGGHDVVRETAAVRRLIGIVFGGERGLYTRLTARPNLEFWAALYGLRGRALRTRVDALLDRMGLAERARDRVEGFSRGMKQRLHLARGLVGESRVVLLDEPTTGMDPVAARGRGPAAGTARDHRAPHRHRRVRRRARLGAARSPAAVLCPRSLAGPVDRYSAEVAGIR